MQPPASPLDVLCVGETLIDLIATHPTSSLTAVESYERHLGGSPTNVAVQVARLGGRAAVASKVGGGPLGQHCSDTLAAEGVETTYLLSDVSVQTTLVLVSRTAGTPEFEVFRGGDACLRPSDVPAAAIRRARAVHTSAFALSREPSRSTIQQALADAAEHGVLVALDPNYHPALWDSRDEALDVLAGIYPLVTLTKPSLDDAARLFGPGESTDVYLDRFHDLGARTVILTLGAAGVWHSTNAERTFVPAQRYPVENATGAGDAFCAGLLLAWLDGCAPLDALGFAADCARWKLTGAHTRLTAEQRRAAYRVGSPSVSSE